MKASRSASSARATAIPFSRSGVLVGVARNSLTLRPRRPGKVVQPNWYIMLRSVPVLDWQVPGARLNVQVDDFEGIFLDELAAVLDVFAHERRENLLGFDNVFEFDFQQGARFRVHGGFPELRGIHFTKALESRDGEVFFGVFHDVGQNIGSVFLGGLVAIPGDGEGRLVELLDLFGQGAQALVFGRRSQGPIDFLVVWRAELDFVEAVLLVESDFAFELEFAPVDFLEQLFDGFLVFVVGFFVQAVFGEHGDQTGVFQAARKFGLQRFEFLDIQKKRGEAGALQGNPFLGFHDVIFGGTLHELAREIAFIANVALAFAAFDAIERRLGDVNVIAFD